MPEVRVTDWRQTSRKPRRNGTPGPSRHPKGLPNNPLQRSDFAGR